MTEQPQAAAATAEAGEHEGHASDRTYIVIGAILAVLTALEVMVFYVPALRPVLVPILMVLMVGKFALVVMYFMHLKFDPGILTGLFTGALTVATAIVIAMMALYERFVV